jgi:hypothetical protein
VEETALNKLLKKCKTTIEELSDLMDAVRSGDYKPDSFTTQPAQSLLSEIDARLAAGAEPVACKHEPFEGRCVHCNALYVNGRAVIPPAPQTSEAVSEIDERAEFEKWMVHFFDVRDPEIFLAKLTSGDYKNGGVRERWTCWMVRAKLSSAAPSPAESGWRPTMRKLVFCARTSGGVAGPDRELMAACEAAEKLLEPDNG